jgi:hypothetical protein
MAVHMDQQRPHEASLRASPHQVQRPRRIVVRLLAESAVVVAMLASGWWGMSVLGAHAIASESSSVPAPVYVAGCPVGDTPQKGPKGGMCSEKGTSHPISTRQPGAGLDEHAQRGRSHGAEEPRKDKVPPPTSEN